MTPAPIWMRLRSGEHLNLLQPDPEGWTDADLAYRLSRTYRWSGDTSWDRPLSVAQHSLPVLAIQSRRARPRYRGPSSFASCCTMRRKACSGSTRSPQ